jgi:putative membrane protein
MNRQVWAIAAGVLALTACKESGTSISNNQTQGQTDEAPIDNMATGNTAGGDVAAAADRTYVENAAASDMFEIESSKLALQKAMLPSLKTFAQMMVDEHGKSTAELKNAAQAAGITVPTALPADMAAKVSALGALSGSAFDKKYLADQRAGHREALAKVNAYISAAPAGPLKDHASKATGVIQKHLNALDKIK